MVSTENFKCTGIIFGLGVTLGFFAGWKYIKIIRSQFVYELVEENKLKTDFLNWVATDGLTLETTEEFVTEFQQRAAFINRVIDIRGEDQWEIPTKRKL